MAKRYQKAGINTGKIVLEVDVPDMGSQTYMVEDELNKAIPEIAEEAMQFWKRQAAQHLNTSYKAYVASLFIQDRYGAASISLGGRGGHATAEQRWLANAIENGAKGWDMKPFYLKGGQLSRVVPLLTKDKGLIFRTVPYSNRHNWTHPGFKGLHLADITIEHIEDTLIPDHINKILDKLTS